MMEFQAIIMAAGTGSRMREITSSIPKCLLPVGNMPLILYPLNILKQAGFSEAIILVKETEKSKVSSAIENKLDLKLDIVAIPKNEDWGTADSLRHIKDKIKKDVIVLSCDLVSDFSLQSMISLHRSKGSSLTVLLVPFPKSLRDVDMPGYKKKCKFERDIIGLDPNGRIIFINSEADFEETVPFKLSVLAQNHQIKVHSNLMDGHVYIFKKELVDFITEHETISTLKGEFLPEAVAKQFKKRKSNTCDVTEPAIGAPDTDWKDLKKLSLELSSSNISKLAHHNKLACFSYIDRECFCLRINTLVAYSDLNKRIGKNFKVIAGIDPKSHPFQKSQVDNDSFIGSDCKLEPKSSVKQSSLGANCHLGERTKITHSIVMDNVVFGKECTVQGSIVCANAIIEENCSLKNCIIGPGQVVKTLTKLNSEILQGSDNLMQI